MHNKVCVERIRAACVTTSRNDKKQIVMTNTRCVFVYSFLIYWAVFKIRYWTLEQWISLLNRTVKNVVNEICSWRKQQTDANIFDIKRGSFMKLRRRCEDFTSASKWSLRLGNRAHLPSTNISIRWILISLQEDKIHSCRVRMGRQRHHYYLLFRDKCYRDCDAMMKRCFYHAVKRK